MKKFFLLLISIIFLFSACGKKETQEVIETIKTEEQPKESQKEQPKQEAVLQKEDLTGKVPSPLTGLYINEESAKKRPVAVMINNLHKALPQSGIGQADILYEALAEGEITRLLAVFQEFNAEKIGPVRSAREYYTYFALDNDAVYVHHGGSPTGYSAIRNRAVNDLDGMTDKVAFFRDKQRVNQAGMYEHSSYVSADGILQSCENKGIRTNLEESYQGMFSFYEKDTDLNSQESAQTVTIPYSSYQISEFHYDAEKKLYERWQIGAPQIDESTGESIKVKNVIVQFANTAVIDSEGRREIDLVGKGEGLYFTNGKAVPISWEKQKYNTPTRWFNKEGKELQLNKGKTFICVYPTYLEISYE